VITAGDFRQIPPPIKSQDVRDVFNASVKSWPVFQSFTTLHLTTPIRTANDPEWTTFCNSPGNGTAQSVIPDEDGCWTSVDHKTWVDLPDTVKCYDVEMHLNDARNWIHPNVKDYDEVIVSALVAVTNKQVDEHSDYFLNQLDTESHVMVSADSILAEMPTNVKCVMSDFTDSMTHNIIPPNKLLLRVNGIYTCMRTINYPRKMMNGTILHILAFNKQYITVHNYTTGVQDDIPRISFDHTINSKSPVKMRRAQFPLRPRYVMTSNIVQGKTIKCMLLDLQYDPFAHGQLHVSCS
jgi:PIF1-like helicase